MSKLPLTLHQKRVKFLKLAGQIFDLLHEPIFENTKDSSADLPTGSADAVSAMRNLLERISQ